MAKKEDWSEAPDARTINEMHTNDDVDSGPEAHHHTIGRGPHQAASGAHNHRDGNGAPILDGVTLTGSKSGENLAVLTTIVNALVAMGADDKTT